VLKIYQQALEKENLNIKQREFAQERIKALSKSEKLKESK
jgi:hypothetical protein